jgi:putative endonuclease
MVGDRIYFTYMLASRPHGTLYTGVTNDLILRTYEHREEQLPGFTRKHDVHLLVWFEQHRDINHAILREKRIKRWRRDWKIALIEESNPHWEDYYPKLIAAGWRVERKTFHK